MAQAGEAPPAYSQTAVPQYPQGAQSQYPQAAQAQYPPGDAPEVQPPSSAAGAAPGDVSAQPMQANVYPIQFVPVQAYATQPQPQTVVVTQQRHQGYARVPDNGNGNIPVLPIAGAIAVLILNILVSGFGTVCGGFFLLCFGHPYSTQQSKGEVFASCLLYGFLQMVVSFIFIYFIGWFWSIYWGVQFITLSSNYGHPFDPIQSVSSTTTVIRA